MDTGVIVGIVIGVLIIAAVIFFAFKSRDWTRKSIEEWQSLPKTNAKLTGTIRNRNRSSDHSHGYYYTADILIDGVWQKAKGVDIFYKKKPHQIGEEIVVAYKPIPENKSSEILDSIMDVMTETLLNEDWEERKPRYYFQFEDKQKDADKVKISSDSWILIGFGILVIVVSIICGIRGV